MKHITLLVSMVWLSFMSQHTLALEANVLAADNTTVEDKNSDWPINLQANNSAVKRSVATHTISIFDYCADRLNILPEKLADACAEFILISAISQTQRLKALTEAKIKSQGFRVTHTQSVLKDQLNQGKIIFWIVLMIVVLGLVAGIFQFVRSFKLKEESGSAEIIISNNQFKFQTTWLGALLLGMSMGFLFLYLTFVYPVSFVGA